MFLSNSDDGSNSSPGLPVHRILQAITDAVIVADDEGIIRYVNRAVQTLFGYREAELLGQDLAVLVPDPHRRQHPEYIRRLRETSASSIINLRREAVGLRSDGTVFPIDLHVGSYQADGRPMFVGIVTDISLRKQAQLQFDAHTKALEVSNLELREMRLAAEAANQAKSAFLANMSHEIRTPMTAILGYADLLASANLDGKERREAVNAISRNGRHLIELLSDILDLSKIEADRLEIEWIPCDVISLVDDMVSMLRVKAQEKALTLTVEYRGKIPQFVRTDPTRLRQILLNLLGNAIKFTERGGVRIVVTGQAVQDPDCQLEFEVIDTGIGIESAQLARLFQPFAQADSSLTRRFGGTGLGLIISRRLAQLLGGDVAVRSTYGEGSVFSLKLRARAQSGASLEVAPCEAVHGLCKTTSAPEPDLQGCQVLLVEDGPDNQRLIAAILQRAGVVVTIAEHGAQALEQVSAEEQRLVNFDLVLMDMQMPVLDGYAATRELRRRGFERPIVALTAHASALDREKCLACGCNDFATKPIDRRNLLNLISRWRQPNCKGSPAGAN